MTLSELPLRFDQMLSYRKPYKLGAGPDLELMHHLVLVKCHRPCRDTKNTGDFLHRPPLRQQLKDFSLARLQVVSPSRAFVLLQERTHHPLRNQWRYIRSSANGVVDGCNQLRRGAILEHISRRANPKRFSRQVRILINCEVDQFDAWQQLLELPARIQSVQKRHPNVKNQYIWFQIDCSGNHFSSIRTGTNNLKLRLEQVLERFE